MEGNGYTVKELITNFVLPELKEIKAEVKTKVDRTEFDELKERMRASEQAQLKEDDVVRILGERSQAALGLGLNRTQTRAMLVAAVCSLASVGFVAHAAGVFF